MTTMMEMAILAVMAVLMAGVVGIVGLSAVLWLCLTHMAPIRGTLVREIPGPLLDVRPKLLVTMVTLVLIFLWSFLPVQLARGCLCTFA